MFLKSYSKIFILLVSFKNGHFSFRNVHVQHFGNWVLNIRDSQLWSLYWLRQVFFNQYVPGVCEMGSTDILFNLPSCIIPQSKRINSNSFIYLGVMKGSQPSTLWCVRVTSWVEKGRTCPPLCAKRIRLIDQLRPKTNRWGTCTRYSRRQCLEQLHILYLV